MRLIKGGVVAAMFAAATLMFSASSALADPVGEPYLAEGTIELDGGLGGSVCSASTIEGYTDGNSVDDLVFAGCSGAAGTPVANNLPWAVSWNGNSGTVNVDATARVLGIVTCRYQGPVTVTYAAGPPGTLTLSGRVPLVSGVFPCPSTVRVSGTFTRVA